MTDKYRNPSLWLSLLPVATLVCLLAIAIYLFQGDALGGASQIVLLLATALCAAIAYFCYGIRWAVIETQIAKNIYGIAPSVLILLLIGTLSGSWMISGVVPSLIYYGLQIMQTDFFLVACCLLCSIVSVMTGSSWTTIATIGIALVGIGEAQGFSTGWIAGAIISGAYFGDKMSPLSDTTVLAASVTDTPLFSHIRYMTLTTVPSMAITLLVFLHRRILPVGHRQRPDHAFLDRPATELSHHALVDDCSYRDRIDDCQEDTLHRGIIPFVVVGRCFRGVLPAPVVA